MRKTKIIVGLVTLLNVVSLLGAERKDLIDDIKSSLSRFASTNIVKVRGTYSEEYLSGDQPKLKTEVQFTSTFQLFPSSKLRLVCRPYKITNHSSPSGYSEQDVDFINDGERWARIVRTVQSVALESIPSNEVYITDERPVYIPPGNFLNGKIFFPQFLEIDDNELLLSYLQNAQRSDNFSISIDDNIVELVYQEPRYRATFTFDSLKQMLPIGTKIETGLTKSLEFQRSIVTTFSNFREFKGQQIATKVESMMSMGGHDVLSIRVTLDDVEILDGNLEDPFAILLSKGQHVVDGRLRIRYTVGEGEPEELQNVFDLKIKDKEQ